MVTEIQSDYRIQKAKGTDIEEIMAVEREGFIDSIQEEKKVFEKRLEVFPDGFFVLADSREYCETKKIAGYFSSEIWKEKPLSTECFTLGHDIESFHDKNGKCFYISSVAVKNQFKGKNLGNYLFRSAVLQVLKEHASIEECVLLVNENWKGARHIYEKAGFEEYSVIENFFADGGSGILMEARKEKVIEKLLQN